MSPPALQWGAGVVDEGGPCPSSCGEGTPILGGTRQLPACPLQAPSEVGTTVDEEPKAGAEKWPLWGPAGAHLPDP